MRYKIKGNSLTFGIHLLIKDTIISSEPRSSFPEGGGNCNFKNMTVGSMPAVIPGAFPDARIFQIQFVTPNDVSADILSVIIYDPSYVLLFGQFYLVPNFLGDTYQVYLDFSDFPSPVRLKLAYTVNMPVVVFQGELI